MEVHRIRLENLRWLMEELNVEPHEIAQDWGTSEQYLRQLLGGKHAKIGVNIATRIEKTQELPAGWLSQRHDEMALETSEEAFNDVRAKLQQLNAQQRIEIMAMLVEGLRKDLKSES